MDDQSRISRWDWICTSCHNERQRKTAKRRRSQNEYTDEERADRVHRLQGEVDALKITNGRLRLRVYDLERAFRLAGEAGIELPDPSDYSQSGMEYVGDEDSSTGDVLGFSTENEEEEYDV